MPKADQLKEQPQVHLFSKSMCPHTALNNYGDVPGARSEQRSGLDVSPEGRKGGNSVSRLPPHPQPGGCQTSGCFQNKVSVLLVADLCAHCQEKLQSTGLAVPEVKVLGRVGKRLEDVLQTLRGEVFL